MEEETIIIKIPKLNLEKELKEKLKEEIERSVRTEILKILLLKKLDEQLKGSELTEEECIELARKAKKEVFEKLKKKVIIGN